MEMWHSRWGLLSASLLAPLANSFVSGTKAHGEWWARRREQPWDIFQSPLGFIFLFPSLSWSYKQMGTEWSPCEIAGVLWDCNLILITSLIFRHRLEKQVPSHRIPKRFNTVGCPSQWDLKGFMSMQKKNYKRNNISLRVCKIVCKRYVTDYCKITF